MNDTILKRELVYNGYVKVEELTLQTGHGKTITRQVARKQRAVAALVYNTVSGKYIFVSQWRAGAEHALLEVAAGVMDKEGETPQDCARREILEETGYRADKLTLLAGGYVSPGWTSEMIYVFYAEVSEKVNSGGGVSAEDEELDIIELTRSEMLSTTFNDFKTIIAVQWAKQQIQ